MARDGGHFQHREVSPLTQSAERFVAQIMEREIFYSCPYDSRVEDVIERHPLKWNYLLFVFDLAQQSLKDINRARCKWHDPPLHLIIVVFALAYSCNTPAQIHILPIQSKNLSLPHGQLDGQFHGR